MTCCWNLLSCAISSREQTPTGLSDTFASEKDTQWQAFLARDRLGAAPLALIEVTERSACLPAAHAGADETRIVASQRPMDTRGGVALYSLDGGLTPGQAVERPNAPGRDRACRRWLGIWPMRAPSPVHATAIPLSPSSRIRDPENLRQGAGGFCGIKNPVIYSIRNLFIINGPSNFSASKRP